MAEPSPAPPLSGGDTAHRLHRTVGLAVCAAAFGLYLKTLAPTVSFWDCGEFISCSYILGVPHPPGAPLYVLLGRLFTLLPLGEVAWRVNLMSALSSALGIWFVYLSAVALARRSLGGRSLEPFGDDRDLSVVAGAALASLTLAVSYTYWFNAVEAEVYGYSILFVTGGLWLIFYWEGTRNGPGNDRWLFLIAYLFGLGGGIHLLCLLIIPSLLLLAWHADERLRLLILILLGIGGGAAVALLVLGPGVGSNGILLLGLAAGIYHLYHRDRRGCWLLLGAILLFALGYSTYAALLIRSGLDPAIDENDPESLGAFIKFLNREQYGTDSQLLGMFQARAARTYQFWHLQMKYFLQQFPFPGIEIPVSFRRATDANMEEVSVSILPYLLGLAGAAWQATRDRQCFWSLLVLFSIMGFGLSFYLNMPDPQPRERHYVFGGMFAAFALWMGLAWTGVVEFARRRLPNPRGWIPVAIAVLTLALPAGIAARHYHIQDRTGDYIAYDYAYNILQSCDENSLLFTNGDNDTFPLWFLQEVEGVRRDVRIINLSLLNTNWYIKQLRDRQPAVDIRYTDESIDSTLTDTSQADIEQRYWPEPKSVTAAGLKWDVAPAAGYNLLRVQDVMMIKIIDWNEWRRPVHIAITVPEENTVNLDPHLQLTGMTYRLTREKDPETDVESLERNLYQTFRFRSITDPEVYKDEQSRRLLTNYRAGLLGLAEAYVKLKRHDEIDSLLVWGERTLQYTWDTYYLGAEILHETGEVEEASRYMEEAGLMLAEGRSELADGAYYNLMAIAEMLVEKYAAADRADRLFTEAVRLRPGFFRAVYGLSATQQLLGNPQSATALLRDHAARYGSNQQLELALEMLQRDIDSRAAQP